MTVIDEDVAPLRVLDVWFNSSYGSIAPVDSHDVTFEDLAECHAWGTAPGRTSADVSEVYRRVDVDRGGGVVFVKVGAYRHSPQGP